MSESFKRKTSTTISTLLPEDAEAPSIREPSRTANPGPMFPRSPAVLPAQPSNEATPKPRRKSRKSRRKEEARRRRRLAFLLLASAFLLTVVGFLASEPEQGSRTSSSVGKRPSIGLPKTLDRSVEKYLRETGDKLNRERIRVQYENLGLPQAPRAGGKTNEPDRILYGLPLAGDKHPMAASEEPRPERLSAEGELHSAVQYDRDLDEWERQAREEYVRQFIENAHRMGYRVRVDKDYNVDYAPLPESDRGPQSLPQESGKGRSE